uniref:DUF4166 domain-containing protein n=1 Tax=Panagrellus redivivus TaxID=6233 RepID=A0A7E4W0Z4_PANRE
MLSQRLLPLFSAEWKEHRHNLFDLPPFWLPKIRDVAVKHMINRGIKQGVVVEKFDSVAIVFLYGSIPEVAIAFRRLTRHTFRELRLGTVVGAALCPVVNGVSRLFNRAVTAFGDVDWPGYTQLDSKGRYTVILEFELYDVRIDGIICTIQEPQHGRVLIPPFTPLKTFLVNELWTVNTVISARIHYDVRMHEGFTTFFEFDGTFQVLPPKK